MREVLIPIGLVVLGLAFIACETFVPSAGILGILAGTSLLAGVVMAYYYGGMMTGTSFLIVTGVVVTVVVTKLVRWWPHSAIGKRILVEPDKEKLFVDRSEFESLVGRVGKTLGLMVPGGYVEIEGKRYDAVAEVAIEPGQWVTVTSFSGGRTLKVRPISEEAALSSMRNDAQKTDPLSQPAGEILDDFEIEES